MVHKPRAEHDGERVRLRTEQFDAVLFDLDGVVTDSAKVHLAAWTATFDDFLEVWSRDHGEPFAPFTAEDYRAHVDGRPRYDGIRQFLRSRRITLPEGEPDDAPGQHTVYGLGAKKNLLFLEHLRHHGMEVYPSSVALVRRLRQRGVKTALVTASRNRAGIVSAARLDALFDATVDGHDRVSLGLRGKPASDTYLEAARRLGVPPERAIVVEDATAGVAAGRAGGFGLVIGVDRAGHAGALRRHGADVVVPDLERIEVHHAGLPDGGSPDGGSPDDGSPDDDSRDHGSRDHRSRDRGSRDATTAATTAESTADPDEEEQDIPAAVADPWTLVYETFDPAVEGRRETLFALGNGYVVTRGAAAESRAGAHHYPGTYLAGGYNRLTSLIEGQDVEHEDLVNFPNWLPLTFRIDDGDWFSLDRGEVLAFRQSLDLRRGLYERTVRVRDHAGRETRIAERRFVHMQYPHLAGQHVTIIAENWSGRLTVRAMLDGEVTNAGVLRYQPFNAVHVRACKVFVPTDETVLLNVETTQSRLNVAMAARLRASAIGPSEGLRRMPLIEPTRVGHEYTASVQPGGRLDVEKIVAIHTSRDRAIADPITEARTAVDRADAFDALLARHTVAWAHLWERADVAAVEVDADASHRTHLVVRLHIFHLLQTASRHTMELDVGIPARGWHGEAYRGHVFWDELFIFPFLVTRIPSLARALLLYRWRRLPEARWEARVAGYRGAMYPWQSGSNGREETDVLYLNPRSGRWIRDDTELQRHVGAAVAWNVWEYYQATGDSEFLFTYGAEMLLEIARFWSSIATWNDARERYDIAGVLGPDEFHDRYPGAPTTGLTNNAYTNVMASWCIARAQDVLELLPAQRSRELCEWLGLTQDELAHWDHVSHKLYLPFSDGILSQFEGYEALEEFDWEGYRQQYGSIRRLDLILEAEGDSPNRYKLSKQADVLMLFYLFSAEELEELFERLGYAFDPDLIVRNTEYYLQRSSEGSTLSGVVHAWVLSRTLRERSWPVFLEALRSDIEDIQGGTTAEGIHLGAMAGTVDILQRCYTGLELRGNELRFQPVLPDELTRLSFHLRYREHTLAIELDHTTLTVASAPSGAGMITIVVDERKVVLQPGDRRSIPLSSAVDAAPPLP